MDCGLKGLSFNDPSLTKLQFAADCDLSNIVKRFIKTGELPNQVSRPTIGDASELPSDFFAALSPAVQAAQAFEQLPLEVRNEFNNDPVAWFERSVEASTASADNQPKADDVRPDPSTAPEDHPAEG